MNIWIDLLHTPQYNFYHQFILKLASEGNNVFITVLNRGKMPQIVSRELSGVENLSIDVIGNHSMNKKSAVFDANIKRYFQLFKWSCNKKIDIAFSNGYLCSAVCFIKCIPSYTFDDDPQTFDYKLKIAFAKKSHYCLYKLSKGYKLSPKVIILKALKEWSYLIPNVFKPDVSVLDQYKVEPYKYLFIREVSVGTVNYAGQAADSILQIANYIPEDMPVLLSLEKKDKRDLYPNNWILLQEPLKDIHSLIYYSCGLISSGDSMAREAALLGVPSYYLGIRYDMPANTAASDVANLQNQKTIDVKDWIKRTIDNKDSVTKYQEETRKQINEKFIDLNQYMYNLTNQKI